MQFAMLPMNFIASGGSADYVNTGTWSQKAIKEANIIASCRVAGSSEEGGFTRIPKQEELDLDPDACRRRRHSRRELDDGKDLRELVEDPLLTAVDGVFDRELHALKRVLQIQIPPLLTATPIHRERYAREGLHQETIDERPEDVVVVEVREQPIVCQVLASHQSVDRSLHQIRDADPVGAPMRRAAAYNLLRYAIGRVPGFACRCGEMLDVDRAALVSLTNGDSHVCCAECFDTLKASDRWQRMRI